MLRGQVLLAGVTAAALGQVAGRAARAGLNTGAGPVSCLGSLLFAAEIWCCAMGRTCARPGQLR